MNTAVNVLIIEDDLSTINSIQIYLKEVFDDTINIFVAQSIKHSAQILMNNNISVILLDLKLPDSSGYETIKRIKNITTNIPVVVLTGFKDVNAKAKAAASGVVIINKEDIQSELINSMILAIEYSKRRRSEETIITTRLDAILVIIDSLNKKLEELQIISSKVDKIHEDIYGNNGIQTSVQGYNNKMKTANKITWAAFGLAGGGAITALTTWLVNRILSG